MNRIAKFEKVSFEQFLEGWADTFGHAEEENVREIYEQLRLPRRATAGSAGYDFFAPADLVLRPGETVKVPTGVRVWMEPEWVLKCYPRSGLGFKYRLQLNNTVGIIDSDYYYSDNEGHIFAKLTNDTNEDRTVEIAAGSGFMVFVRISSRSLQLFSPPIIASNAGTPLSLHISEIGAVCSSPRFNCMTSRGAIFPAAALDIILSRSPMSPRCFCTWRRSSWLSMKWLTTEYRDSSSGMSITGIANQFLSSLAPIGEEHLSMTEIRGTPSPPAAEENISRFRKVNLSIQTNLFSSILEMEQIFFSPE